MIEIDKIEHNNLLKISEINNNAKENLDFFVKYSEGEYRKQIYELTNRIQENKNIKFILLAGPSSSGKTTTARLITEYFNDFDIKAKTISLDNFFVDREETPLWSNGKPNYESVDAIDWKLFDKCIHNLIEKGECLMPTFNFLTGEKVFNETLTLKEKEIIVIEGLHALNPIIDNFIPVYANVKVYISPRVYFIDDNGNYILNGIEMRFFRRLIRDAFTRGASVEKTLEMWPDVLKGENLYIKPFKDRADFHINSCHNYEVGVYKSILMEMELLDNPLIKDRTEKLQLFDKIDKSIVPKTSLLTEFVH